MVNWILAKFKNPQKEEVPVIKSMVIQAMRSVEGTGYVLDIPSGQMYPETDMQRFNITIRFTKGTYAETFIYHSQSIEKKGLIITNVIKLD